MSDSASSPSSSLIIRSPPHGNVSPPSGGGTPPPSHQFSENLIISASPPAKASSASPPPPKEQQPPLPSNSPPPSSPPPSSPPPSASPPPNTSNKQPPPAILPSPSPPLPEATPQSPPPPSSSSSSSTSPPFTNNKTPFVSGQSNSPPSPSDWETRPSPPLEFLPPSGDVGGASPPSTKLMAPSPPTADAGPVASNVTPTTKSAASDSTSSTKRASSTSASTAGNAGGSSDNSSVKIIVGAVVAGFVLIAVVSIIFLVKKKKKRKNDPAPNYMPPKNFSVQTDGYFHGQQPHEARQPHGTSLSAPVNFSYGSPLTPHSPDSHGENGESGVIGAGTTHFSYEDVMEMTGGFSRQNIIGEGGFGCVFKGQTSEGKFVAVKQLKAGSGQGNREFKAEVEIISRVHHKHLVSLVGYCIRDRQRLLLYEFLPNKTLEHHLHGTTVLDWSKRLRIAIGSAKGLAYLHEDCDPKIIHRDIKSANILLDENLEAKVADFGLARLSDTTKTHVSTRVMGTFGYLAPEYASSGKLTDRSDVYSFGVVLLELITGRKPVDPTQPLGDESLVEWARPQLLNALETGNLSNVVDRRLGKQYVESEMLRMIETAAACVRHSAPKRPRMVQVVRQLDTEELSDINNGVKVGQSTAYDSGQYSEEIMKFRMMAFASGDSSVFDGISGEYSSREISQGPSGSQSTSRELQIRAMEDSGVRRFG